MKNIINKILIAGILVAAFASCEENDNTKLPNIEKVVSMRLSIDPDYQVFNALDIPNAFLRMSLYTEGTALDRVELMVDYYSFTQDSTYATSLAHTFSAGDFNGEGIIPSFDLTTQAISAAVGIDIGDIDGGDRLDFSIVTITQDGRTYPATIPELGTLNTTPNILNSSSTTSLSTSFTAFVACPVPDGYLTGSYHLKQVSGPVDPFFGTGDLIAETDVNIEATTPINREFGGLTYATFSGGQITLLLVCNSVIIPYGPAPASCGGGLGWTGDTGNIFVYDDGDDSSLTLNLLHNPTGDCGLPVLEPWVFELTKN